MAVRAGELRVVRVVAADPEQAENAVQGRAHVVADAAEEVGPRPRRAVRLGERGLELLLVLLFCGDRVVDIHEDADGGVGEAVLVAAELRGVAHPDVAARLGPNPVRDVIGRGPGPCDGAGCLRRRGGYIRGKLPHELHAQQRVRLTLVVGLEALDRSEPAGLVESDRRRVLLVHCELADAERVDAVPQQGAADPMPAQTGVDEQHLEHRAVRAEKRERAGSVIGDDQVLHAEDRLGERSL